MASNHVLGVRIPPGAPAVCFLFTQKWMGVLFYISMRRDKEKAEKLRKLGKSYREIKAELGIPRTTLSDWFKNHSWSKSVAENLNKGYQSQNKARIVRLNRVRGVNLVKLYEQARKEAEEEFVTLKYDPLFISGVVIYWGEGDKASKNGFRVANSDPLMIRVFVMFLETICGDKQRIRASLLLYPDINDSICRSYWEEQTGLSKESFTKSTYIKGKHGSRRLKYGVCTVSFSSRYLKEKMLVWIRLLSQTLVSGYINAAIV